MPNLERFESPVLRPKLVSDYVKNWNVILDLTNIQGVSTEVECVICADTKPLCRIAKTECGHEYCVDCVKSDIRENKDKTKKPMCPLCRTELCEISIRNITAHSELQEFCLSL